MDDELLELQRQFEFAQQAKSSIRLSERNVVELVQKLQELRIIDFDLLHTVSGREYITPEQLRREIANEIKKKGRISLIDLAESTAVDLYHVEKQAQHVVANDSELTLIQGEIISQTYWDSIAEEINERLEECSEIALSELATQLQVSSETIVSMLEPRLGTLVKGRLEGGQLYTPAYVARVSAMVRGAARGITVPTNVAVLWSSLQKLLQEMDGASGMAVEGSFFQSIFNNLIKEGSILGSLHSGVHWTPTVFSLAQKECVESFFSQNSFISYEGLQKLGIPNPIQFMQSRYPEGIHLVTTFVHRSMIDMLDATAEDTIEHGSWISSLSVLPSSFGSQDASKLLSFCPSVKLAIKFNKAVIFGDSYLFSNEFIKDMHDRLEKEMESSNILGSSGIMKSFPSQSGSEVKLGEDSSKFSQPNETANERQNNERVSKKKKGKSVSTNASNAVGSGLDDEDHFPAKSKKNQKKSKDVASLQVMERKASGKRESVKSKDDNLNVPSEEWVMQKIKILVPDFEEQGVDDPLMIIIPLTNYFQPMLVNSLKERRKTLFSENADRMKRLLDNLQRNLDEAFLNLQLYEKALDLFDDDQSTSVILHRHLLRTTAAPIADMFFVKMDIHNKIKNGIEVEESQNSDSVSLSPGERATLAQNFPGSLSSKALTVVEALEGKRVAVFVIALGEMAEESQLHLKKLDKKLERTLLHSYRKDLTCQVSAEVDPVSLLPKVVSLLYIQIHHKALQAPGRAISVAVSRLKESLDESRYKILSDYQAATVTFLALVSAAAGDEDGCSSDRILSKKELLESQMQALKGLVLTSSQS